VSAQLPDLYAVLGVPADASDEDIKRAYRKLAREHHPDVSADPGAEQRFKEISAAYQTLSDPQKRRQYDTFGSGQVSADFPFGGLTDLFEAFFGGGGFGGGGRRASGPRSRVARGEDLYLRAALTFEEAAFGVEFRGEVDSLETCPACTGTGCAPGTQPNRCGRCGGSGQVQDVARSVFGTVVTARRCGTCDGTGQEIPNPCTECRGEGRIAKRQKVTVQIPAGVAGGTELRVADAGAAGRHGGPPGDLYVGVEVAPHPVFERRGQDLVCALRVPLTQAVLGTQLEVDTLDGAEVLDIQPGTASGTVLRVRGKGIPHLGRKGRGDLYVNVVVEMPSKLSRKERELVERLAELRDERPAKGSKPKGMLGRLMDR
jgi:molecular chaperone DnaJ